MIFGKDLANLVTRGKKTETRRPLQRAARSEWITSRDGSRRRRPPARVIQLDGTLYRACRYQPGHTYSVQKGRGKPGTARIVVTAVRRERAGDIDFHAARAEGFATTDDWKAAWVRIHDKEWVRRELVDEAAVYNDEVDIPTWILCKRFEERHATRLVWVIAFQLERDAPRLLGPAGSGEGNDDDGYDYTFQGGRALGDSVAPQTTPSTAPPDPTHTPGLARCACRICRATASSAPRRAPEPEAVDHATLARFTADAAERRANEPGRREEDLRARARSLARRLRQEADAGVKSGLDVIADLQRIEEQIRLLERAREAA